MKKHKNLLIAAAVIFIVIAIALIPKAYIKLTAKGHVIWESSYISDGMPITNAKMISLDDYSAAEFQLDGYDFVYNICGYNDGAYIFTAKAGGKYYILDVDKNNSADILAETEHIPVHMSLYKNGAVFVTETCDYSNRYAEIYYTDFSDGTTALLIPDVSITASYDFTYIFTCENQLVYPKITQSGVIWYIYDGEKSTRLERLLWSDYCKGFLDEDTLLIFNQHTNRCGKYSISAGTCSDSVGMTLGNRRLYPFENEVMLSASPRGKYAVALTVNGYLTNQTRSINIISLENGQNVSLDYSDRFPVEYKDYFCASQVTWVG